MFREKESRVWIAAFAPRVGDWNPPEPRLHAGWIGGAQRRKRFGVAHLVVEAERSALATSFHLRLPALPVASQQT